MAAVMMFSRRMRAFSEYRYFQPLVGLALLLLLAMPLSRQLLESSLINHMLVQIPLLALVGWLMGKCFLEHKFEQLNRYGIPGLLIAVFAILFWMIPRWLDAALSEPIWEVMKFITVPLFIGLPLGISWWHLSSFSRAVVWTNTISMLLVLGWLYVAAPVRVCNNYLVNQQQEFGYVVMSLAVMIALYWVARLFFGSWEQR